MLNGYWHGLAAAAAQAGLFGTGGRAAQYTPTFAAGADRARDAAGRAGSAASDLFADTGQALGGLAGAGLGIAGSAAGRATPYLARGARAVGRGMWGATRGGARLGARGAWGAAKFLPGAAMRLGGAGVTAGATAGAGILGAAYGAQRLAYAAVGGQFLEWSPVKGAFAEKLGLHTPGFTRRASGVLGLGMLAYGVAQGVQQYAKQHTWNLTEALATGAVEVERESFMGATGSLTIASSRRRPGLPANQPPVGIDPHAFGLMADDLAIAAARMF